MSNETTTNASAEGMSRAAVRPNAGSTSVDFSSDPRMQFSETTGKWSYVADDGLAYEYDEELQGWFPVLNEELVKAQQSAYSVPGVDESEPVISKGRMKRKDVFTMDESGEDTIKKQKKDNNTQKKKPTNTSVYVTGLPRDVAEQELAETFSKCGVLMEDFNTGGPRIKLYKDASGRLKGDALVTYLKEESVQLAVQLLDDTDLRPDEASRMSVQVAEFKPKEPKDGGNQSNNNTAKPSKTDKRLVQQRLHQLEKKLDWHDNEMGKKADRYNKIVILKHMFTLEEIEEDISLIIDLKEDIRTECETLGEVTNVILYDKEPEGVVSVKFKDQISAQACVLKMNGRYFGGRVVQAEIYDGDARYKKSDSKSAEGDVEEAARLEKYAKWLEHGGDDETDKQQRTHVTD